MIPLSEDLLEERGFTRQGNGLWTLINVDEEMAMGVAVLRRGGASYFGGAQIPMSMVRNLCRGIIDALASDDAERKRKARKVLQQVIATDLIVGADGSCLCPSDPELAADLSWMVGRWRPFSRIKKAAKTLGKVFRGEAKVRWAPKEVSREYKKRFKGFTRKVADSKILQAVRKSIAKLMEGPVGKAAAKAAGFGLQAFGIPAPVTESAVRGMFKVKADRLRKGGWAGVAARGMEGGGFKGVLREEGRRWKGGGEEVAQSLRETAEALLERGKAAAADQLKGSLGGGGGLGGGAFGGLSLAGVAVQGEPLRRPGVSFETLGRLHASHGTYEPPVIIEDAAEYHRGWIGRQKDRPGGIGGGRSIYELGACA